MQVYISETAFWDMLIAAVEVYQKETYGIPLGHRDTDMFFVDHVIICQKAYRHVGWVKALDKPFARMINLMENLPNTHRIGDFHSHTVESGPYLTNKDKEGMVVGEIELIVGIWDKTRKKSWGRNRNNFISGTIGDYFFKIGAYYLDLETQKPKSAEIICPTALGLSNK